MAIRLRTFVTALAIVISLVSAPTLTNQPVFALGCGIDPIITVDIGTAEAPPYSYESLNDTAFLAYSAVGGPSATLDIPVTRYLAPVDPATGRIPVVPPESDSHHMPYVGIYPTHLESLGILGAKATLKFSYSFRKFHYLNFDKNKREDAPADSSSPVGPSRLRFNGTDVTDRLTVTASSKTVSKSGPGQLTTTLNGVLATLEMNIWEIRFPTAPGVNGNPPSPGVNTLEWEYEEGTIGISQGDCLNYTTYSGAAVSWAGIEIKALAPVVLVHGIGGEAEDWTKGTDANGHLTEAESVTTYLTKEHVTYSNKINLTEHGERDSNGVELSQFFRDAATELGAKGIHVIAHSKGGLDTRSFLANHADDLDQATGIHLLSLSTLSTPHHGSILADLSVHERAEGRVVSDNTDIGRYLTNDRRLNLLNKLPFINFGPQFPGLTDLTTEAASDFNEAAPFPDKIALYTYGADANFHQETPVVITAGQNGTENETAPMIPRVEPFFGRQKVSDIATSIYLIGASFSSVKIVKERQYRDFLFRRRIELKLDGDPFGTPAIAGPSDLAVTIPSSHLEGESEHLDFTGASGLNHTSMRTRRVAVEVLAKIKLRFPL